MPRRRRCCCCRGTITKLASKHRGAKQTFVVCKHDPRLRAQPVPRVRHHQHRHPPAIPAHTIAQTCSRLHAKHRASVSLAEDEGAGVTSTPRQRWHRRSPALERSPPPQQHTHCHTVFPTHGATPRGCHGRVNRVEFVQSALLLRPWSRRVPLCAGVVNVTVSPASAKTPIQTPVKRVERTVVTTATPMRCRNRLSLPPRSQRTCMLLCVRVPLFTAHSRCRTHTTRASSPPARATTHSAAHSLFHIHKRVRRHATHHT